MNAVGRWTICALLFFSLSSGLFGQSLGRVSQRLNVMYSTSYVSEDLTFKDSKEKKIDTWASPNTQYLGIQGPEGFVLYDLYFRDTVFKLPNEAEYIFSFLSWHPSGTQFFAVNMDGYIYQVDASSGSILNKFIGTDGADVSAFSCNHSGNQLAIGTKRGDLNFLDPSDGSITSQKLHRREITGLAWSRDDAKIVTSGKDKKIIISKPKSGQVLLESKSPSGSDLQTLHWSLDNQHFTGVDDCGKIFKFDSRTLVVLGKNEYDFDCAFVSSSHITENGSYVAIAFKNKIVVFKGDDLTPFTVVDGFAGELTTLSSSIYEDKLFSSDHLGFTYYSRLGYSASILNDLNEWIEATSELSISQLQKSIIVEELFGQRGFQNWVSNNPSIAELLVDKDQFETEEEHKKRFLHGLSNLVDQLSMNTANDARVNFLFEYLTKLELSSSRKPITLYPRDFKLGEYNIEEESFLVSITNENSYPIHVGRDEAKSLYENLQNCAIQGIAQKNPNTGVEEYINLKLINRTSGKDYLLGDQIDLLEVVDKSQLPPELSIADIRLNKDSKGNQQLSFELKNVGDGIAKQVLVELLDAKSGRFIRFKLPDIGGRTGQNIVLKNSPTKPIDLEQSQINIQEFGGYQLTNIPIVKRPEDSVEQEHTTASLINERKLGDWALHDTIASKLVKWNSDGRYIAVYQNKRLYVWDVISRQILRTIQTAPYEVTDFVWGYSDLYIIAFTSTNHCVTFKIESAQIEEDHELRLDYPILAARTTEMDKIVAIDSYGQFLQVNYKNGTLDVVRQLTSSDVTQAFLSPRFGQIAVCTEDSLVLVNYNTGISLWSIPLDKCIRDIAWNSSERFLLTAGCDSIITVVEAATGKLYRQIKDQSNSIVNAKWSEFGNYIITMNEQGGVTMWDGFTGAPFDRLNAKLNNNTSLSLSPTGQLFITIDQNNLSLWNAGNYIETLSELTTNGVKGYDYISNLDSLFAEELTAYFEVTTISQFETQDEYQLRLVDENIRFAKRILQAKNRIQEREILRRLDRNKKIAQSRTQIFLDKEAVELGRYDMLAKSYPVKYNNDWYDLPLDRDEARQLFNLKETVKIRVISQLDSTLTQSQYINPSLVLANGKEYALGTHENIQGGMFTNILPPKLNVKSVQFIDNDGDNTLAAGEGARLKFIISNDGEGSAEYLRLHTSSSVSTYSGLSGVINVIQPNEQIEYYLELQPDEFLMDTLATLKIGFAEANGFSPDSIAVTFQTKAFKAPVLRLVDFAVADNEGRPIINKGELVDITLRIANYGEGPANAASLKLISGENVFIVGGANNNTMTSELGALKPGQTTDYHFQAFCNKQAEGFDISLSFRDNYDNPYSELRDIGLTLNKTVKGLKQLIFNEQEFLAANRSESTENELLTGLPAPKKPNENAIAVVIGNKNYRGNMPPVEYALNDAFSVKEYLKAYFGLKEGNIILLEDATLSEMKVLFGEKNNPNGRLMDLVKKNQTELYVYYSGHGAPDLNSKGYLMPTDANPARLELTAYSMDDLVANIDALEAKEALLIVDACFSGGVSNGDYLVKNASSLGLKVKSVSTTLPENISVITASEDDQVASWYTEKQHGLFTYYLLKGIKGDADKDGDLILTFDELKSYITDTNNGVPYKARELYSRTQVPKFFGTANLNINLNN